jgi:hypothetical protein
MKHEAFKRIGHLYPKVKVPKEQGGGEATVIAWIWARTVKCPNPACGCEMPLVRSALRAVQERRATKHGWSRILKMGQCDMRCTSGQVPQR